MTIFTSDFVDEFARNLTDSVGLQDLTGRNAWKIELKINIKEEEIPQPIRLDDVNRYTLDPDPIH